MKNIALFLLISLLVCSNLMAQSPFIDSLRNTFDEIHLGKNKKAVLVLNTDKFTLYDKTGKALPDMYEGISLLDKGLYMINKNGKYALMDTNFTFLTGFLWDNIQKIEDEAPEYNENVTSLKDFIFRDFTFLKVKKGDLYGLIDKKGASVLEEIYSDIHCENNLNGLICKTKDKAGFLGNDGKWILPLQYDELTNIYESHTYFDLDYTIPPYLLARLNGKMGVFADNGKEIIPLKYDDINLNIALNFFEITDKGKKGYTNFKGENIVPIRFSNNIYTDNYHFQTIEQDTFYLYDTTKLIFQTAKYPYIHYEGNGYFGMGRVDTNAKEEEKPIIYDSNQTPTGLNVSSCAPAPPPSIKVGLMDFQEREIIPPLYEDIRFYSPHFILFSKEDKWALFNAKGKQLTDFILDETPYLQQAENSPYLRVFSNLKMGIIDTAGKTIIPMAHNILTEFSKDTWLFEDSVERQGVINKENKILVPALYKSIGRNKGYWEVGNSDNLHGLIDSTTGKIIVPCAYNMIVVEKNFIYATIQNEAADRVDIFSLNGKEVTHSEENKMPLIIPNRNIIVCYKNNKMGASNNAGKTLIPFKYEAIKGDIISYKSNNQIDTILYFLKDKQIADIYNLNLKHFNAEDSILWVSQADELRNFKLGIKYETKAKQYGIVRADAPHTFEALDDVSYIEYDSSTAFHHAQKGEKTGLLDNNWEWLIPLQDSLLLYAPWTDSVFIWDRENYAFVTHAKKHKYGLYGIRERRFIFPPIYDKIQALNWNSHLFIVEKKGLYALANAQNELIIPYQKHPIIHFEYKMLLVYKDKKHFQLVDTTGKVLFAETFEQYKTTSNLFILTHKGIPYYFNDKGQFITHQYEVIVQDRYYFPNYFTVTQDKNREKKRLGLIGMNNREIVPAIYDYIQVVDTHFVKVIQNTKMGLYNTNGNFILPAIYDYITIQAPFLFVTLNGKQGVCNLAGKVLLPPQYESLGESPIEAIKVKLEGKWGMMDTLGNQLIPCTYDALSEMLHGKVVAQKDEKCGLLSSANKWILAPEYEGMEILRNDFLKIKRDCKYRLLNPQGKEVQSIDYEEIETTYTRIHRNEQSIDSIQKGTEYLFLVYNEGKMGVVDSSGNFLFPCIYTAISLELDQKFILAKDSVSGVLGLDLQPFIPFEYEDIAATNFPLKSFYVEKAGKIGVINQQGKLIIPLEFTSIYYNNNAFTAYKESEGRSYFFDKDGNEVEELQGD